MMSVIACKNLVFCRGAKTVLILVEIDAGDATVVDLSPELAEVGAALMP